MTRDEIALRGATSHAGRVPELRALLLKNKTLTRDQDLQAHRVSEETQESYPATLLKLGLVSDVGLANALAEVCDCDLLSEGPAVESLIADGGIRPEFLHGHGLVPYQTSTAGVRLWCWNPLDELATDGANFALGEGTEICVGPRDVIRAYLERHVPLTAREESAPESNGWVDEGHFEALKDLASDAPVIRLVQTIIERAIQAKASDIHVEPAGNAVVIRFRTDGLLQEFGRHPLAAAGPLASRLKIMAGLDIAEKRLPQDGRIRTTVQGKEIDFRVATAPTQGGESVVLRVLDRQDVQLDFDALGFDEELKTTIRAAIGRPHGVVLVTGPTGSGKTTTLYAALKEISSPARKVLTIEDPVEYLLEGVNQVAVRSQIGLTFAQALRAFLRQDPDILMVGEIRDHETAVIAIQAALTGHLLLSTLHTNTAAGAIARLIDMGIDDYLLTSTLHLILAQRLVRRLCVHCRVETHPLEAVMQRIGETAMTGPWFRARGCEHCHGSGYRGRTSIVEAMSVTERIRRLVLEGCDAHKLERAARDDGMRTMLSHGLWRIQRGETSAEEVLRVTALE